MSLPFSRRFGVVGCLSWRISYSIRDRHSYLRLRPAKSKQWRTPSQQHHKRQTRERRQDGGLEQDPTRCLDQQRPWPESLQVVSQGAGHLWREDQKSRKRSDSPVRDQYQEWKARQEWRSTRTPEQKIRCLLRTFTGHRYHRVRELIWHLISIMDLRKVQIPWAGVGNHTQGSRQHRCEETIQHALFFNNYTELRPARHRG